MKPATSIMDWINYIVQAIITISAVLLTFILVRLHDKKQYKNEREDRLDDFVKNIVLELEYNKGVLESEQDKLNKYHYVRDYYFRSSLNSGLIHLVKNDTIQKFLPSIYHELEMYKETPIRIRERLMFISQLDQMSKKNDVEKEVEIMNTVKIRIVKNIKLILNEFKRIQNKSN